MHIRNIALAALGLVLLAGPSRAAGQRPACAGHHPGDLHPIEGEASAFLLRADPPPLIARWPEPQSAALVPTHVIRALDHGWDADGSAQTVNDTLVVPEGSTVRWQLATGIHTLTSGRGASDPDAGLAFDYLLDDQHPSFDSTFADPDTVDFFCFFHEPRMRGVLIVTSSAGVPPEGLLRLSFTQPPRPNPSRGTVSFDIGVPRALHVRIEVLDLQGSRVAVLHDGPLAAGGHPFRWRGLTDRGARSPSGVYVVVLQAGATMTSRRVSLLR